MRMRTLEFFITELTYSQDRPTNNTQHSIERQHAQLLSISIVTIVQLLFFLLNSKFSFVIDDFI